MLVARSAVFILCFSIYATAQTRTLAVYPGAANGPEEISYHYLKLELQRVLSPAGVELLWPRSEKAPEARQGTNHLVVGSYDGNCSVESLPEGLSPTSETKTLADTSVSGGRILPYIRVDCSNIVRILSPALQHLSVPLREAVFGRALARVIAHEIYHILAQTADHGETGLAKSELSSEELTVSRFDLSPASLRRMQPSVAVKSPAPTATVATLSSR